MKVKELIKLLELENMESTVCVSGIYGKYQDIVAPQKINVTKDMFLNHTACHGNSGFFIHSIEIPIYTESTSKTSKESVVLIDVLR